ncbi:MAG: FkbM family methyltransferase [Alphaproteobacteria bacterium]|nr:FkbM family methyltransferase [Alphaproteobacteria bacterium]
MTSIDLSTNRLEQLKADNPRLRRSLEVYYGDPARDAAMDALHARFIAPGNLAFDIGSHVGDRIGSFRRMDANVVALEPQPDCAAVLRALYDADPEVTIIEAACGSSNDPITLNVNSANPTVTTASSAFIKAAQGAKGWEGQSWDRTIKVPSTTVDELIARYGLPRFAKIDVEGFEDQVLEGLSQPLPTLSFEFTTIERDVAYGCLNRLATLGPYRFDIALGETQEFTFGEGHEIDARAMVDHIRDLHHDANSGDIYAMLQNG